MGEVLFQSAFAPDLTVHVFKALTPTISWEVVYYTHGSGTLTRSAARKYPFFRANNRLSAASGVPHSERSAKGYCNGKNIFV